jgi:hypothetical protein
MRVKEIIEAMGGRAAVQALAGIKTAQISHFLTRKYIPAHHIRLFIALRPELDWGYLLNFNTQEYIPILTDQGVQRNRAIRLTHDVISV